MKHTKSLVSVSLFIGFIGVIIAGCTACSPRYVTRAAYEQATILLNRQSIDEALQDPAVSSELKIKLAFVKAARVYAEQEVTLKPGDSYTYYTQISRDVFSWIVVGSYPDRFELHTWWFPVVGSLPYKGYFDKEQAIAEAQKLKKEGYEASVRGAQAYSSLGWFNDPVLSTALQGSVADIVDTVIHETLHRTVWIPEQVNYNESLANFVGTKGATQFFLIGDIQKRKEQTCQFLALNSDLQAQCLSRFEQAAGEIVEATKRDSLLSDEIMSLYKQLSELYQSGKSREVILKEREELFGVWRSALQEKLPHFKGLQKVNNADIMQLKLYYTDLPIFAALFTCLNNSWQSFLDQNRQIASQVTSQGQDMPFQELKRLNEACQQSTVPSVP